MSTALKLRFPVHLLTYGLTDIKAACETIKPTLMMIDPHTMLQLAKTLPEGSPALKSLRDIRLPAMDMPAAARKIIQAALHPDCLISRPYGGTEMGTVAAALYDQRENYDPSGVGYTFPGIQVKLTDDDGSEVTEFDTPGEILVKTPAMFTSYYNNPAGTAKAFRDGWFVTGDIGYISSKTQQWCLVGRKDFVFKVSGKYVAPEELESLLVSHDDIVDAAIVPLQVQGRADPVIRAFVVPKSANALTEGDVLSFVESRLPQEKRLTGGVNFVDSIPRSALRKILRWKLHDMAKTSSEPRSADDDEPAVTGGAALVPEVR
jgi:4-coumarate--CoA ligase